MTGATPSPVGSLRADDGLRPRREHLRPRLPGVRGSAARPAERRDRAVHQHTEGMLRDRPWRPGEDRAAGARRPHDPPRGPRGRLRGDRRAGRRRVSRTPRRSATRPTRQVVIVFLMLFCAAQAPELFGRDQRYRVLPLYFSRAITRVRLRARQGRRTVRRPARRGPGPAVHPVLRARAGRRRPRDRVGQRVPARCPGSSPRAC